MITFSGNASLVIYSNSIAEGQSMTQECRMSLFLASSVTMGVGETMDSGWVEQWGLTGLTPHPSPTSQELWHWGCVWHGLPLCESSTGLLPAGPAGPAGPPSPGPKVFSGLIFAFCCSEPLFWTNLAFVWFSAEIPVGVALGHRSSCGKCQDSWEEMGTFAPGRCQVGAGWLPLGSVSQHRAGTSQQSTRGPRVI